MATGPGPHAVRAVDRGRLPPAAACPQRPPAPSGRLPPAEPTAPRSLQSVPPAALPPAAQSEPAAGPSQLLEEADAQEARPRGRLGSRLQPRAAPRRDYWGKASGAERGVAGCRGGERGAGAHGAALLLRVQVHGAGRVPPPQGGRVRATAMIPRDTETRIRDSDSD